MNSWNPYICYTSTTQLSLSAMIEHVDRNGTQLAIIPYCDGIPPFVSGSSRDHGWVRSWFAKQEVKRQNRQNWEQAQNSTLCIKWLALCLSLCVWCFGLSHLAIHSLSKHSCRVSWLLKRRQLESIQSSCIGNVYCIFLFIICCSLCPLSMELYKSLPFSRVKAGVQDVQSCKSGICWHLAREINRLWELCVGQFVPEKAWRIKWAY